MAVVAVNRFVVHFSLLFPRIRGGNVAVLDLIPGRRFPVLKHQEFDKMIVGYSSITQDRNAYKNIRPPCTTF